MTMFRTVAEALAKGGQTWPESRMVFQDQRGVETNYPYPELERLTAERAASLAAMGLAKGDRVGMIVVEPEDFVLTFLAAVRIGVIPVPMYPPLSFGSLDAYAERSARILTLSKARVLVASAQLQNVLWSLVDKVPSLERLVRVEDVRGVGLARPSFPTIAPDDMCFLQYTSGSTSDPKGVVVTHGNLVSNAGAIVEALGYTSANTMGTSWLPLYHDMGLIGCVITPILHGLSFAYIPTIRFIKKPSVWFETMHRHRATTTFAPNFAYALIAKKAKPDEIATWDLSSVQTFGCGAEPIQAQTVRDFHEVFGGCAIRRDAFLPAYGMAEATLCMSVKPLGGVWHTNVVDAEAFQSRGVVAAPTDDASVFEHMACGPALPRHELAILDDLGNPLPDGQEGEICFRGPSVCPGYFENPEATRASRHGEWLRTGDLGYLLAGEVYVTGRLKDLIILNGRNLHPQSIEWVVAEVEGVRKGNVVAFSRPGAGSEELVVVLETKEEDKASLGEAVKQRVQREMGCSVSDVVCVAPGELPKTSSGKLQRRKTREMYLQGGLGTQGSRIAGSTGDSITLARHVAASMWSRAKNAVLSR